MTTATDVSELNERRDFWLFIVASAVATTVVAGGLRLRLHDGKLGTASAPFVAGWAPAIDGVGLSVALIACACAVLLARQLVSVAYQPKTVAAALFTLSLAVGLAVNMARTGTQGWTEIFDLHGGLSQGHAVNEYLPGLPTLRNGVPNYLDRYAEVTPSQSVNVAGHPPGPLLLAHLLHAETAGRLAALVILIGSLCAPLSYVLSRTLSSDERTARLAGCLCATSPLTVLFGVTSYDYAFAAIGTVAACGLVSRSPSGRTFGVVALAGAALMSWALLGVAAWAVLVVKQRDGVQTSVLVAVACGTAIVASQGALAVAFGYDPVGTFRATEQVYRDSLASVRPYWFWTVGSPVAWGLMLGPMICAGALRGIVRRGPEAHALAAVVFVAAVGGFTKAETERIWLFLVPLACVAAAPHLRLPVTVVVATLLAQALLCQLFLNTVW